MFKIRKAQISIDYIGGATVFFVAILFIVVTTLNVVPRYSENLSHNRLQVTGWTISTTLLETPGYWSQGEEWGYDWHEPTNIDDVKSLGLEDHKERGLDRDKIEALDETFGIGYIDMKNILATEFEFHMDFTEFVVIDTSMEGDPDREPTGKPGGSWGYEVIDGEGYFFYVYEDGNNDFEVHVGQEDGSGFEFDHEITSGDGSVDMELGENGREYTLNIITSGVIPSEGDILVLEKDIKSIGRDIHLSADEMINIRRFSNIEDNIVRVDMRFWKP